MRTTLLAVLALCAPAYGSPDDALVSAFTLPLNGAGWTAQSSTGIEVRATVPGDLISDLETAGVVGPTWLDLNWQADSAVWDLASWTYSTTFPVAGPLLENYADAWLVLDSIKMTANVTLNGVALGMPTNQHRRYTFSVGSLLKASGNVLEIAFGPTTQDAASDASGNRFMGCSGGWDWCVGSGVRSILRRIRPLVSWPLQGSLQQRHDWQDAHGRAHLLQGDRQGRLPRLHRGRVDSAVQRGRARLVRGPLPHGEGRQAFQHDRIYNLCAFAAAQTPLSTAAAGPWVVNVTAYLDTLAAAASAGAASAGANITGTLTVSPQWAPDAPVSVAVSVAPGSSGAPVTASLAVPQGAVELWWPAGLGAQALYEVNVSFAPSAPGATTLRTSRTIGFRSVALVTADDSNPAALAGLWGSGNLTLRWKVNGADVFARGANWIPPEEVDARVSDAAVRQAVQSAVDAGMNALRVWGGGLWPQPALTAATDALGVLLYVDAMYASQVRLWGEEHERRNACGIAGPRSRVPPVV